MYVLLFAVLLGFGAWLVRYGSRHRRKGRVWGGGALVGSALGLIFLMAFWAEMLWFDSLGYQDRFWTFVWVRLLVPALGGVAAGFTGMVLTRGAGVPEAELENYSGQSRLPHFRRLRAVGGWARHT